MPIVNVAQVSTSCMNGASLRPCTTASLCMKTVVSLPPISGMASCRRTAKDFTGSGGQHTHDPAVVPAVPEELGCRALGVVYMARQVALADRKKHVYDEDIEALVDEEIATAQDHIKLMSLTVIAGTRGPQRATMRLDIAGKSVIDEREGNGPVDATFNCIKAMVPHDAVLELYQVHAVTEGTDAQAEVSVRLSEHGRSVTAKGADPDTLVASAKAYLAALNKLMVRRQRGKLEPITVGERRIHSQDVG